jgi:hemerythrin-like metal-binding protein
MMEGLTLGIEAMDTVHEAFITLLEALQRSDDADFIANFHALLEHTCEHFANEEALMRELEYYGLHEHAAEHQTLLDEMRYFFEKAKKFPPMGRSYINDYAFEKFRRHIINIDSQLAMFVKERQRSPTVLK